MHDVHRDFGIEIAGRLVGKDNRRIVDDGAGDGDALLFAAGKPLRKLVAPVFEANVLQQPHDAWRDLLLRRAGYFQRKRDIFEDRFLRQQLEILKHDADISAQIRNAFALQPGDVEVIHKHRSLRRQVRPKD